MPILCHAAGFDVKNKTNMETIIDVPVGDRVGDIVGFNVGDCRLKIWEMCYLVHGNIITSLIFCTV